MKILILVISSKKSDLYMQLEKTVRETWASDYDKEKIDILFLHSNKHIDTNTYIEDDILYTNSCDDNEYCVLDKMIEVFKYLNLNNFKFDYIFRTNVSTYIDTQKLYDYIINNNLDYGGPLDMFNNEITFASGHGYIISKKSFDIINENLDQFNHNLIDDVAVADLLKKYGIKPINIKRKHLHLGKVNEYYNDKNIFMFRCVHEFTDTPYIDRNDDHKLMKKIHQLKLNDKN